MTSTYSASASIPLVPTIQFAPGSTAPPTYRSSVLSPPSYSHPNPAPRQSPLEPSPDRNSQAHVRDHASTAGGTVYTIHTYGLKEYAYVFINSHANSPQDTPVIYRGEETTGTIQFSQLRLQEVQSITVVLRVFDSDPTNPTYKTKPVLLSGQIDPSHTINEEFRGHFAIAPPTIAAHDSGLKFELQITIHRRGYLTRKIIMRQPIRYSARPDPPNPLPLRQTLARNPHNLPSYWNPSDYPAVVVRGDIFQHRVEVGCKLIIPTSYPVCDNIPLCLVMACVNRAALDLFAVSDAIDIQLLKVLAFGNKAAAAGPPFHLKDRKSYHITKWVAKAHWYADGEVEELPPDDEHPSSRWRAKLSGELHREPCAEISHGFSEPGMAVMYYVCLFPFRAPNFRPISNPDKVLFYGQILLSD